MSQGAHRLQPCPFCGCMVTLRICSSHEDDEDAIAMASDEYFAVCCDASTRRPEVLRGCGAHAGYRADEDDAVRAWNERK